MLSTPREMEVRLGDAIRRQRLQRDETQATVARRANIDRTTLARIERGGGGSIESLVRIAVALDRAEWLDAFAPPAAAVSPMRLLEERRREEARTRRRARGRPPAA